MKLLKTLLLAGTGLLIAGQASADEALAKAKNCMSCHAMDKKVVGPSYKDVAKKYAGNAAAAAELEAKVKKGGSGKWVRCRCRRTRPSPMPTSRSWSPGFSRPSKRSRFA